MGIESPACVSMNRRISIDRMFVAIAFVLLATNLFGIPPSNAATVQVTSHIAFGQPATVATQNDIQLGRIQAISRSTIRISTFGMLWVDDNASVDADQRHRSGAITLNAPQNQVFNLYPTNYRPGLNVLPREVICSVNDSSDSTCSRLYTQLKHGYHTFRIGMEASLLSSLTTSAGPLSFTEWDRPFFDMYIIFQ